MKKKKTFTKSPDSSKILLPFIQSETHSTQVTHHTPSNIMTIPKTMNPQAKQQELKPQSLAPPKPDPKLPSKPMSQKSKVAQNQGINWSTVNWSLTQLNSSFRSTIISDPGKSFEIRPFPNTLKGCYSSQNTMNQII